MTLELITDKSSIHDFSKTPPNDPNNDPNRNRNGIQFDPSQFIFGGMQGTPLNPTPTDPSSDVPEELIDLTQKARNGELQKLSSVMKKHWLLSKPSLVKRNQMRSYLVMQVPAKHNSSKTSLLWWPIKTPSSSTWLANMTFTNYPYPTS